MKVAQPKPYAAPLSKWWAQNLQPLIDGTGALNVHDTIRINWYHEAFDEKDGEFVTVEKWNGFEWEQFGLDVNHTVGDLLDLNEKLGG